MSKNRIWELDALRGLCILGMIAVHLLFDLTGAFGIADWEFPPLLMFVADWGGAAFFLISGVCATLGSRSVRRGLIVLGCGLTVSAVTVAMYRLGMAPRDMVIYFGVLHCLGACMLLWPLLRRLPTAPLGILALGAAGLGLWFGTLRVRTRWLVWLGLMYPDFATSDYFPLLPFLGFFLLGAVLGRICYREKKSLLPGVNAGRPVLRFLRFLGRWSLPIYMLHQPVLTGILSMILVLKEVLP